MFLLQAISMDVDKMPFGHLIAVLLFLLVVLGLVFMNGLSFKIGDKEINIGGIRRLLARKDEDTRLKESLKRFSDDVDHETEADLYDLIEDMDTRIEHILLKEHCYFTLDKFSAIVKKELYKRVRRNNLKDRLSEESVEKYVEKVLKSVEERYELFQAKVSGVKCGDKYSGFQDIKDAVRQELLRWAKEASNILIAGMNKKIAKYEGSKSAFKTSSARKFCCDDCIAKNKAYIERLHTPKKKPEAVRNSDGIGDDHEDRQ
jgi:hypothetical protein